MIPSEGAIGVIGLMAATRLLIDDGRSVTAEEAVIGEYFDNWLKWKRQPIVESGVNQGAVVDRAYYDSSGQRTSLGDANAGSTGITMVAMYKRYEFLRDTGRTTEANAWLSNADAWKIMKDGFEFLKANYNSTHQLVRSRNGQNDLWLTDATLAACAMRCLRQWALKSGRSASNSLSLSNNIRSGIYAMKDTGS